MSLFEHQLFPNYSRKSYLASGWSSAVFSLSRWIMGLIMIFSWLPDLTLSTYLNSFPFSIAAQGSILFVILMFSSGVLRKFCALFFLLLTLTIFSGSAVTVILWSLLYIYYMLIPEGEWGRWLLKDEVISYGTWTVPALHFQVYRLLLGSILWVNATALWSYGSGSFASQITVAIHLFGSIFYVVGPVLYFIYNFKSDTYDRIYLFTSLLLLMTTLGFSTKVPFSLLFMTLFLGVNWMIWPFSRSSGFQGDLLFYDGECGLCHFFVKFLISEDRRHLPFHFSPQSSKRFQIFAENSKRPASVWVYTQAEEWKSGMDAIIYTLAAIGGFWGMLSLFLIRIPKKTQDKIYRLIADYRLKVMGRSEKSCPTIDPELKNRFELD